MRIIRLAAEMPGGWLGHVPLFCPKLVTEGNSQFLMALTQWLMAALLCLGFLLGFENDQLVPRDQSRRLEHQWEISSQT